MSHGQAGESHLRIVPESYLDSFRYSFS